MQTTAAVYDQATSLRCRTKAVALACRAFYHARNALFGREGDAFNRSCKWLLPATGYHGPASGSVWTGGSESAVGGVTMFLFTDVLTQ
eukprot:3264164-Pyramimonas_sp.AAC.1